MKHSLSCQQVFYFFLGRVLTSIPTVPTVPVYNTRTQEQHARKVYSIRPNILGNPSKIVIGCAKPPSEW